MVFSSYEKFTMDVDRKQHTWLIRRMSYSDSPFALSAPSLEGRRLAENSGTIVCVLDFWMRSIRGISLALVAVVLMR